MVEMKTAARGGRFKKTALRGAVYFVETNAAGGKETGKQTEQTDGVEFFLG
jgi:hypothetical protein